LSEGSPNVVERIDAGEVDLVINTPTGSGARADGYEIRRAAVGRGIPCITTMSGASAAQRAIRAARAGETSVISLQELHGRLSDVDGDRLKPVPIEERSSAEAERGA
jgi:carbamoyl-phosphate synthase large subunit